MTQSEPNEQASPSSAREPWFVMAFIPLGLLVGNLVGMTSESVITSILGLLFAFTGGSIIGLLAKIAPSDRRVVGQSLLVLTSFCLIGVYMGIIVTEYQLLSPPGIRSVRITKAVSENKNYLRDRLVQRADAIDMVYHSHGYTAEQAYEQLYKSVKTDESDKP